MIYLYWYLGIGVVVLVIVLTTHHLTKDKAWELLRKRIVSLSPHRRKIAYSIRNDIIPTALTVPAIVLAWPIAAYVTAKKLFMTFRSADKPEERQFLVNPQALGERLSVQEIETREILFDPLDGVSALPFGHLNHVWQDVLKKRADGDELWSFTAIWQPGWAVNNFGLAT